ncbi:MAG: HAD-IIIA family hydrolase [Actinomycetota bacterium]|nr:HAD-IIIA family hydrolase [Actinomycetota bacterium]
MIGVRAAFVDRDGVINELVPDPESGLPESPLNVEDVTLVPGAAAALASLAAAGWLLAGVSNQPAAAKGNVSVDQLLAVQSRVLDLLDEQGVHVDDFRLCLHHPEGTVPGLSTACDCRKPAPGMLLEAGRALAVDLARSWMIGDTDADVLAGRAAGCQTVLIQHLPSAHKRGGAETPTRIAADLPAAARILLESEPGA